jgi:hypothetical protein
MCRTETLVAFDWNNADLPIGPVLDFLSDAFVTHTTETRPHWNTGAPQLVHLVAFDADRVRNTEVHGAGYRAGFVVHIA